MSLLYSMLGFLKMINYMFKVKLAFCVHVLVLVFYLLISFTENKRFTSMRSDPDQRQAEVILLDTDQDHCRKWVSVWFLGSLQGSIECV